MRKRGFETVKDKHKGNTSTTIQETMTIKREDGLWVGDTKTPDRADPRSAGYDFYAPVDITIMPTRKTIVMTDVKAYMESDELLGIYPRSSMGIKQGMMIANTVGIVDSSYYENEKNDGNIMIALLNTSGKAIHIKQGDRFAQGVFSKYLTTDDDTPLSEERTGGVGSSGQ